MFKHFCRGFSLYVQLQKKKKVKSYLRKIELEIPALTPTKAQTTPNCFLPIQCIYSTVCVKGSGGQRERLTETEQVLRLRHLKSDLTKRLLQTKLLACSILFYKRVLKVQWILNDMSLEASAQLSGSPLH